MAKLFDMDPNNLDHLPKEKHKLFEECSPITHLTKDDAPVLLIYNSTMDTPVTNQGTGIHHPKFGKALKEKMDTLGIECEVATGVKGNEAATMVFEFVKKHFGMK